MIIKTNPHTQKLKSRSELFWEKVLKFDTCCWVWAASHHPNGYGQFAYKAKTQLAHRAAYELSHGPIPPGLNVLHRCDVRNCMRPDHLWVGTHQENSDDMVRKGRQSRGEKKSEIAKRCCQKGDAHFMRRNPDRAPQGIRNGQHKLSEKQVLEIYKLHNVDGVRRRVLADQFGMSIGQIDSVVTKKSWRHLWK